MKYFVALAVFDVEKDSLHTILNVELNRDSPIKELSELRALCESAEKALNGNAKKYFVRVMSYHKLGE